jgi:hypothetical protein
MDQLGLGLVNALGGKVEKKSETVMGKTCDVTTAMGVTVHSYKGVTLRSSTNIKDIVNLEEAIRFDENATVNASTFAPPALAKIEDISREVSGNDDFYDELDERSNSLPPSGLAYDKFKSETDRVRRELGYSFAMHDNSDGMYAVMCTKGIGQSLAIMASSLTQTEEKNAMVAEMGLETFTNGKYKMAYGKVANTDEETGKTSYASVLMVEMPEKDALLHISSSPVQSKDDLLALFKKLSL